MQFLIGEKQAAGRVPDKPHWKAWATALLPAQSPAQYKAA